MDEQQIQEIADRLLEALEGLAPGPPGWWVIAAPIAVFLAAGVAALIGGLNLRKQQHALTQKRDADAKALKQKQDADDRAEWWRRVQWALEAEPPRTTRC